MNAASNIQIFSHLGAELSRIAQNTDESDYAHLINGAIAQNAWFTPESVQLALKSLGQALTEYKIAQWLSAYNINTLAKPKNIGIVMAGNIPLVGFHDLLCTLVSCNNVLAKLSSKDQLLYDIIKDILVKADASFKQRIIFTDEPLKNIDAIIATGSDNSARYFEYYFGKYPNIIRKNRNSIGILSGIETIDDLKQLSNDIFTYYGLGCRNVSLLLVPENYSFDTFFEACSIFEQVGHHNKYANNYEYQKAITIMNRVPVFDNGFVLLKQDSTLASAIAIVHYLHYKSENEIVDFVETNKHKIQCIVSKTKQPFNTYGLGMAQQPELWDYADNMDTLSFLLNLK